MLRIEQLTASIDGTRVLHELDLFVPAGEVHVVMGPNGAGKSTLANVLAGREGYDVSGRVTFDDRDLLGLLPEERAAAGLFLAFQHPTEIPGVGNAYFLRTALNSLRQARGLPELGARDVLVLAREHMARLDMDPSFLTRSVNDGFSGGEKKRNEILQMSVLEPRLAVLDETDSGLDVDALRIVARGIARLRSPERSFLIITHHRRLLEEIQPDRVHVLKGGRIALTGDHRLAIDIEANGYDALTAAPA